LNSKKRLTIFSLSLRKNRGKRRDESGERGFRVVRPELDRTRYGS
jgi:hypothetical protein